MKERARLIVWGSGYGRRRDCEVDPCDLDALWRLADGRTACDEHRRESSAVAPLGAIQTAP